MIDDKYEQVLYSVCKSLINSETMLSRLELYREVINCMVNMFGESEPIKNIQICGKVEEFTNVLDFCLIILTELGLIQKKSENMPNSNVTSFNFKWNGIKGFTRKYLSSEGIINTSKLFEELTSKEKQLQIFTRIFISYLIMNVNSAIDIEFTRHLTDKCKLNGFEYQVDKIISTLLFISFISTNSSTLILNLELFNQGAKNLIHPGNIMEEQKFRPLYIEPEQFNSFHNDILINKSILWQNLINDVQKERERKIKEKMIEKNKKFEKASSKIATELTNLSNNQTLKYTKNEVNSNNNLVDMIQTESDKAAEALVTTVDKVTDKFKESGYAMLKGSNWTYYMKDLCCIIGRAPEISELKLENTPELTWEVDISLGKHKHVSKQHALIAYNFDDSCFEVKNLSKKYKLQLNGEEIKPGEEMPLSSKSIITIGNQEFTFFLPL